MGLPASPDDQAHLKSDFRVKVVFFCCVCVLAYWRGLGMHARNLRTIGLAACAWLCMTLPSVAAEIELFQATSARTFIIVVGDLVPEDSDQFRTKTLGIPSSSATVVFKSDGGSVVAAIGIGTQIRLKQWTTVVPANNTCASACALAWLGGTRRLFHSRARIGFHAAYINQGGHIIEKGAANALVGAYLNDLGLSKEAIFYITSADPSSMQWLSADDARAFGIEIDHTTLPHVGNEERPPVPSSSPENPHVSAELHWGRSPLLYQFPFPGVLPPSPEASASRTELEQKTANFITSIMASWSGSNENAATAMRDSYDTHVTYYGQSLLKDEVLTDKLRFIERWPKRKYVIRTLGTSCVAH